MKKKLFILGLMICLVVSLSGEVLAADHAGPEKKAKANATKIQSMKKLNKGRIIDKKAGNSIYYEDDYVDITYPKNKEVFYKGEIFWYDFSVDDVDVWEEAWTGPTAWLLNQNDEFVQVDDFEVADIDDTSDYEYYVDTSKLSVGTYLFGVTLFPYLYEDDEYPIEGFESMDLPEAALTIYIKQLKAPTGVKAVAGKKKVTVSFKGSAGATKYEIYRSLKKGSGYKRVKVTSAKKFVDKKVKKGKKYYYKVKAVRSVYNPIKSGFSAAKRSGKVKK